MPSSEPKKNTGRPPSERPSKICPVCNKPFAWRKAWRNSWHSVVYCSERCRNKRNTVTP